MTMEEHKTPILTHLSMDRPFGLSADPIAEVIENQKIKMPDFQCAIIEPCHTNEACG
jgi:hypothetical protein